MESIRVGDVQRLSLDAAPGHAFQARDGQARQADGHLVAGTDIQCLPTLQGADADPPDLSIIQPHRHQIEHRRDPSGAADLETDLAHMGQCPGMRVFPGDAPMGRPGLPASRVGSLALAQHHAIAGKGQRLAKPVLAPVPGLGKVADRSAVGFAVGEAEGAQAAQAFELGGRSVGPVPDKQADTFRFIGAQLVSCHQSRDLAAGIQAAVFGLYMVDQAPIQFALQHQVQGLWQLRRDGGDPAGTVGPVLALESIATADGLVQPALSINQGHGHAVDLGLNPQVLAALHPLPDRLVVRQLVQSGMGRRVGNGSAGLEQRVVRLPGRQGETSAPLGQGLAGLIVEFVGHWRNALAVVELVPARQLLLQGVGLASGAFRRPIRALAGIGVETPDKNCPTSEDTHAGASLLDLKIQPRSVRA